MCDEIGMTKWNFLKVCSGTRIKANSECKELSSSLIYKVLRFTSKCDRVCNTSQESSSCILHVSFACGVSATLKWHSKVTPTWFLSPRSLQSSAVWNSPTMQICSRYKDSRGHHEKEGGGRSRCWWLWQRNRRGRESVKVPKPTWLTAMPQESWTAHTFTQYIKQHWLNLSPKMLQH